MELIEQEELMIRVGKKVPESTNWNYTRGFKDAIWRVRSMIHSAPTIDAAPVVHGHWITRYDGPYKQARKYCSACGKHSGLIKERPFCPNCGARMDGGEGT